MSKRFCECGEQIHHKTMVDGIIRNTSSRKRCLNCKPFGAPSYASNTIRPKRRIDNSNAVIRYRQKVKLRAINYLGSNCWACGYSKCKSALVFHHIDPASKSFSIGNGRTLKWETVEVELKKCALLCQNCHSEVHEGLIDLDFIVDQRLQVLDSNQRLPC